MTGITEKRSFPNRLDSGGLQFEKPDLEVLDVSLDGVLYTVLLAVQHFRRQRPDEDGFRGPK